MRGAILGVLLIFRNATQAYMIDLPNSAEQASSTSFVFSPGGGGTLQWVVSSNLLSGLSFGERIVGISFRLDGESQFTLPNSTVSYLNWNLQISQSVRPPGFLSNVYANNQGADLLTVRSGPLTIPAGSYPTSTNSPAPWGTPIAFQTPYTYRGGDLIFTLTGDLTTRGFAVDATTAASTSSYQALHSFAFNDPGFGGSPAGTPAFQIIVPEPAVLSLTSLVTLLLVTGRRR